MIEFVCITGKRGCGKSQWLKKYSRGFPRVFIFDPTMKFPGEYIDHNNFYELEERKAFDKPRWRYNTIYPDLVPAFSAVGFTRGDIFLGVDECSLVFLNPRAALDVWSSNLTLLGRHARITTAVAAQRAMSIPITMRSQASRFVTFRQTEKNDLAALSEWYGGTYQDIIPNLPELRCLDSDSREISEYSITYDAN